MEFHLPYELT